MHPRFIMIGGFLGAGKTTTIARLAHHYQSLGKNIVIVTNDQAADLVDTHLLRSQGYSVGEVAGSCFCCNFNALTETVEQLGAERRPDIVLAEPVGSCTDLVATVIRPLESVYAEPFDIAPYGVIVKPSHGLKILAREKGGFSPQAEYIFRKQLEEADFIIINRIDELTSEALARLTELINIEFPGRSLIQISAKTGQGFDGLYEFLDQQGEFGRRVMDVDYDVYAAGEAELGWLNSQLIVSASHAWELDTFLLNLLGDLQSRLSELQAEVAHLKAIGMSDGYFAVANVISSADPPQLSLPSYCRIERSNIVINARVALDPQILTELVNESLDEQTRSIGATSQVLAMQSFRPGRPVPTHRL